MSAHSKRTKASVDFGSSPINNRLTRKSTEKSTNLLAIEAKEPKIPSYREPASDNIPIPLPRKARPITSTSPISNSKNLQVIRGVLVRKSNSKP